MTQTFGDVLSVQMRRAHGRTSTDVDTDLVQRLSQLPEDRVLDFFWLMSRRGAAPLWLLLQLSAVVLNRPVSWDRAAIRRAHEREPGRFEPRLSKATCFACLSREALYFHHLVEVQNGGSNSLRNKVPLCFPCHQYLHPWLTENPAANRVVRGFESLYQIFARDGGVRLVDGDASSVEGV